MLVAEHQPISALTDYKETTHINRPADKIHTHVYTHTQALA